MKKENDNQIKTRFTMTWLFFVIATIQSLTRNQLNTRLTSNENQMKLCWVRDALKLSFCGPQRRAVNKLIKRFKWDKILPLFDLIGVINCPSIVYHTSQNCHLWTVFWEVIWYYGMQYDTGFSGFICTPAVCKLKDSSIESTSFHTLDLEKSTNIIYPPNHQESRLCN